MTFFPYFIGTAVIAGSFLSGRTVDPVTAALVIASSSGATLLMGLLILKAVLKVKMDLVLGLKTLILSLPIVLIGYLPSTEFGIDVWVGLICLAGLYLLSLFYFLIYRSTDLTKFFK